MGRFQGTAFAKRAQGQGWDEARALKLAQSRPDSLLGKLYAKTQAAQGGGGAGGQQTSLATKPARVGSAIGDAVGGANPRLRNNRGYIPPRGSRGPGDGGPVDQDQPQTSIAMRPAVEGGASSFNEVPREAFGPSGRASASGDYGFGGHGIERPENLEGMMWAGQNMPGWMKKRGASPEQVMKFIERNPESPLAQKYKAAGISSPGGGVSQVEAAPGGGQAVVDQDQPATSLAMRPLNMGPAAGMSRPLNVGPIAGAVGASGPINRGPNVPRNLVPDRGMDQVGPQQPPAPNTLATGPAVMPGPEVDPAAGLDDGRVEAAVDSGAVPMARLPYGPQEPMIPGAQPQVPPSFRQVNPAIMQQILQRLQAARGGAMGDGGMPSMVGPSGRPAF